MAESDCFLPGCRGSSENKKFSDGGIRKLIACASTRGDEDRLCCKVSLTLMAIMRA